MQTLNGYLGTGLLAVTLLAAACSRPSGAGGTTSAIGTTSTIGTTPRSPASPTAGTDDAEGKPDPAVTDPDKYKVVLENEKVRVLHYQDHAGDKTHPHYHRQFVLYALTPFKRRLILGDGTVKERAFATGDVIWMPAQVHTGVNIGDTDTDVLIVELK